MSSNNFKSSNKTSNTDKSGIKFKSSNKIAAYDIDFYGIDRSVLNPTTDSSNDQTSLTRNVNSQKSSEISLENSNHTFEALSEETLHQDMLFDSKTSSLAIVTDSIDGYKGAVSLEPSRHNFYFTSTSPITYKSKYFMSVSFLLLFATLLPLQYHSQNFLVQIKKMQDSCTESKGYFNENQTYILDTIFPYGFSSGLEFDSLNHQLKVLNKIQQNRNSKNYTIRYMSLEECKFNNLTNLLNIVTVSETSTTTKKVPFVVDSEFVSSLQIKPKKQHKTKKTSNVILICDDEKFKDKKQISENQDPESSYLVDNFDIKTNVLTQWNISCRSLSTTTATISYSQMTFLSGQIVGAIFFSMLADYLGRKKIYLITLYSSSIIGSIASIVQTYKQFVFVRFPIALITQGCYIMSYVLLFELILNSKKRSVYCTLFIASQFFWNILIGVASKFFQDWRYMQLTGSLLASLAVGYPWLIKESYKWLIVRDDFIRAEKVCKKIFIEKNTVLRLIKMKLDDHSLNANQYDSTGYWPVLIWQPTFRKIISFFVLIWSGLSLINFFINEEAGKLLSNNINDYSLQNGILFAANVGVCLIYYFRLGKRFPLGLTMIIGSAFYLAFTLTENVSEEWLRISFLQMAKIFISCAFNILMFHVCDLFPCEIRCSSFSFFISIKHLSEMFAIYIFKVNYSSISTIRISLSVICMIVSIFAFLLPERSAFSFNLDYSEYLNRYNLFKINSSKSSPCKNMFQSTTTNESGVSAFMNNNNGIGKIDLITSNYIDVSLKEGERINCSGQLIPSSNLKISGKAMYVNELSNVDDCETYILANSLIKKINCENHCKTGKLNPLYEEEAASSNQFIGLPSSQNQNVIFGKAGHQTQSNNHLNIFSKLNAELTMKLQSVQQSSTKF